MYTAYGHLEEFQSWILGDPVLTDFCTSTLGAKQKVHLIPDDHRLKSEDTPWIVLLPGPVEAGEDRPETIVTIDVLWALTSRDRSEDAGGNVTYTGLSLVDRMGTLIWEALRGRAREYPLSMLNFDTTPLEQFPLWTGSMEIKINSARVLGRR